MKKLSLLFILLLTSISTKLNAQSKTTAIFKQYCATCHGETIEAFVDRNWKHGKTKPEIIASISEGYINGGMPSWKATLSKKQVGELANYITKSIKKVDQYQFSKIPKTDTFISGTMKIKLDTIISGLESPWGLTQLPDMTYLVTDRKGELYHVDKNKNKVIIKNTPSVLNKGQGGLLDVEIHPDYTKNGWVYLSYSKFKEEDGKTKTTTAVVRGKLINNEFSNIEPIFEANPYVESTYHYGCRLVFDGKGHLYISVGERGKHFEYAQGTDNDLGKIHKINDDGTFVNDNPFTGKQPNSQSIISYGNRNPQGLTLNPSTGELWETEHGPRGGDEINIIKPGNNYGWPTISYGINYDGKPITNLTEKEGMLQPLHFYVPSIAPSGLSFVVGDKYPAWKGNLLIGSLRFNYLERCVIENNKVTSNHKELMNIGRMRNVKMGADGFIYLGLENPGIVVKLVPSIN